MTAWKSTESLGYLQRPVRRAALPLLVGLIGVLAACGSSVVTLPPSPVVTGTPSATPTAMTATRTIAATPSALAVASATPPAAATATIPATGRVSATRSLGPFTLSPTPPGACFAAGFGALDPQTFAAFASPVREYLYYRKRAFISGTVQELWARYPALQYGADSAAGINDEGRMVVLYKQVFKLIDGDIDPEHYERFKIRRDETSAEIIVHMLEIYLRQDYSITGSEVVLKLSFQRQDGGWPVVRTDELKQGEPGSERQCH